MASFNRIAPCLWFDDQGEAAAAHYTKIFDNSRIVRTVPYTADGPGEVGTVMTVDFELDGMPFTALNGGPMFTFSEAISLQVLCKDQAEVDRYWDALVDGGAAQPCGWLKDRFGVSWQVVPTAFYDLFDHGTPEQLARATKVVLDTFGKLDVAAIQAAAGT